MTDLPIDLPDDRDCFDECERAPIEPLIAGAVVVAIAAIVVAAWWLA